MRMTGVEVMASFVGGMREEPQEEPRFFSELRVVFNLIS